jgi:hypothetical protein
LVKLAVLKISEYAAEKSHYYPSPCTALWGGGEGGGGCYLYGPKVLLNKNMSYT